MKLGRISPNITVLNEFATQTGSCKDIVADRAISTLLQTNSKVDTIVVPSSGAFGISAALAATQRGIKCMVILPESVPDDSIRLIRPLPLVEIIRTHVEAKWDTPESPWNMAVKLQKDLGPSAAVVDEYIDDAGVWYGGQLAEKIKDCDAVVVYSESGAILKGLESIKQQGIKLIGVKPASHSILGSGGKHTQSRHEPQPDEWITVTDKQAFSTARRLIGEEGVLTGIIGGAVVAASLQVKGKLVAILPDSARTYSSTLLNDDWLMDNQLADEHILSKFRDVEMLYRGASVEDMQLPEAVTVQKTSYISHALEVMLERDFSQLPVLDKKRQMVGFVSLGSLQSLLKTDEAKLDDTIESKYPVLLYLTM
jgi:cystathionine beta-synthase